MKKCKVIIIPVEDRLLKNRKQCPIVVCDNEDVLYPSNADYTGYEGQLVLLDGLQFAHIEFRDENDNTIASTEFNSEIFGYHKVPQSFIDQFIASNGSIKEVMVETTINDVNYHITEMKPKFTSSGEVIIHPVKTKMEISDIPVEAIKNLLAPLDARNKDFCIISKWLKDNNL